MPHDSGGSTIDKLIDQGINLLEAGDSVGARELLSQAVVLDPHNEKAWLWRAGAVETDEERRRCLNRVLAINPHNTVAQRGLKRLEPPCEEPEAAAASALNNGSHPRLKRLSIQPDAEMAKSSSKRTPQRRLRRLSVQGPRLESAPQPGSGTSEQTPTGPAGQPHQKSYSREMLYWPEPPRSKKPIWLALLVGIVIVAFGTYAVLHSLNLVGAFVVLPELVEVFAV